MAATSTATASTSRTLARPKHLAGLTGLRFFAAFVVLLYHTAPPAYRHGLVGAVIGEGYVGVSLFFVLSGFILSYNYLRGEQSSPRAFWGARLARVYPVYALGLLVAVPYYLYAWRGTPSVSPGHLGSLAALTATLTQSWHPSYACQLDCPGWSLSCEAFFYLAFPVIGWWLARQRTGRVVGVAVGTWAAVLVIDGVLAHTYGLTPRSIFAPDGPAAVLKYDPALHLPEFFMGMAAWKLFDRFVDGRGNGVAWLGWAAVPLVALIAAVLVVFGPTYRVYLLGGALAPLFAGLVVSLALGGGILGQWLGARPVVLLGEASYALYILHVPAAAYWHTLSRLTGIPESFTVLGHLAYSVTVVIGSVAVLKLFEEPARRRIRGARVFRRAPSAPELPAVDVATAAPEAASA